jgi:hypothetical protein
VVLSVGEDATPFPAAVPASDLGGAESRLAEATPRPFRKTLLSTVDPSEEKCGRDLERSFARPSLAQFTLDGVAVSESGFETAEVVLHSV